MPRSKRARQAAHRCRHTSTRDRQYAAPKEFLTWAQSQGWSPGPLPVGAIFTSQTFITSHLEANPDRFCLSDSLTPTNGRVFLTTAEPSVAVACLGVGATAVVTLLEQGGVAALLDAALDTIRLASEAVA